MTTARFAHFVDRYREHLRGVAAILAALALALLIRVTQGYASDFQTFPVADWIEFTFGPNDAAAFGSAADGAWLASPALAGTNARADQQPLTVLFAERQLRRQIMGLESEYAIAVDAIAPPETMGGRLELRVFRNASRAEAYRGMRLFQLFGAEGLAEVTPLHSNGDYRVWVGYELRSTRELARTLILGRVGPAVYQVSIRDERETPMSSRQRAELIDATQALTEDIASVWSRSMLERWASGRARA